MPPDISQANKILIIRLSSLGDIILTTPLVRTLKERYPRAEIHFLLKKQYAETYMRNPHIAKLLYYEDTKEFTDNLRKENYDLVVDLHGVLRSRKLVSKLGKPYVRLKKNSVKKFILVRYKINLLKDAGPIPERYAETIPGFKLDAKGLEIFPDATITSPLPAGKDYICFAPGSRWFTKMWPLEYYIELGRNLTSAGYTIVLLGGASDKEICAKIAAEVKGSIDLSGADDLSGMAANMKMCRAAVCNDSGLMHLACAANIPTLVFFGSTVKEFGFAPYKNKSIVLEDNALQCRPCSHIGRNKCPLGHFKCMRNLTPEAAQAGILKLIRG
jgi:heptosyltransferase-2